MAGGCGDDDFVWSAVEAAVDDFDMPAGHFSDLVAAFALAAAIDVGGGSAVGVSGDVVEVSDGCVAEGSRQVWSRSRISLASQPSK